MKLHSLLAALLALASLHCPSAPAIDSVEGHVPAPRKLGRQSFNDFAKALGFTGQARVPWYALHWRDGEVEILPFRGYRERPGPFDWKHPEVETRIAEPDCADCPLMAFRVHGRSDEKRAAERIATGKVTGLALGEAIGEGWSRAFDMAGNRWTLRATYVKGSRGRILPGSMRLTVEGDDGRASAVLERHPGLIFGEQTLLWAGDITQDGRPDFLIRRTLVTGEIDYILSLSSAQGPYAATGVTVDPDKPANSLFSAAEEADYEAWRHANSPRPYPVYKLPEPTAATTAGYALSGPMKVKAVAIYAKPRGAALTPGVKRDFAFIFAGESWRLLAELVPTWEGRVEGPGFMPQGCFGACGSDGGLALSVSIQHRGVKQVLLVMQPRTDEGPVRLTAGDIDGSGRLSLSIDWRPHHEVGMNNTWTQADEPQRLMRRVSSLRSLGR